ncbi:MAG: NAD-dependent epimerase/dehydratase family protein [Flavobacteriaceae bacterium]
MKKVFVSGGSGYIAMYCIKILISKGYHVVTSVIDKSKIDIVKNALINSGVNCDNIDFKILNLLYDEGWDDALNGCEYVLHMASPVIPGDVDEDLVVKPAVEGMERCLNSAIKNGVKKFVQTSSYAAIYARRTLNNEHTDTDWTDLSNKKLLPYEISKTKSEKKMWEIVNQSKISACAINPVLVLGPSMSGILSMSNRLTIKKLFNLPVLPDMSISVVGVQDVAEAHVMAMENDSANGKRFLLSEKTIKLKDLSNILKDAGFKKVPTWVAPNFLLKLVALFTPSLRMIAKRLGSEETLFTNNANNILGWYPKRVDLEIINSAQQLYDVGILKK